MNVMRTQNNHNRSFSGSGSQNDEPVSYTVHKPVLLQKALSYLNLRRGYTVVDATLGGGGHFLEVAKLLDGSGKLVGMDVDFDAIQRVMSKLRNASMAYMPEYYLVQSNFRHLDTVLKDLGILSINAILFDLGISSDQLENSGRGFSFQKNEPLRMTMSKEIDNFVLTAWEIVNTWSCDTLADIIYGYGNEKYAKRIANAIVKARRIGEINTTHELVEIIKSAVPGYYRHGKIHFATKTFQALRITVNDELRAIREALEKVIKLMEPEGRIVIITFHSLEDRLVKRKFKKWQEDGLGHIVTKKPICPDYKEVKANRRARSAKLRVFEKK